MKKCPRPIAIEIVDRYSATGTPRPDPATVCTGHCEGMGFYPERCDCKGTLPNHKQQEPPMQDYCWVKPCPDCNGTGKRPVS